MAVRWSGILSGVTSVSVYGLTITPFLNLQNFVPVSNHGLFLQIRFILKARFFLNSSRVFLGFLTKTIKIFKILENKLFCWKSGFKEFPMFEHDILKKLTPSNCPVQEFWQCKNGVYFISLFNIAIWFFVFDPKSGGNSRQKI